MDELKRKRLEANGWDVGTVEDFLSQPKPNCVTEAVQRLTNELAIQVETDDPNAALSLPCDIQTVINAYIKIHRAWHYLNEVNDQNMKTMRDLTEEIKKLNHELNIMRKAID